MDNGGVTGVSDDFIWDSVESQRIKIITTVVLDDNAKNNEINENNTNTPIDNNIKRGNNHLVTVIKQNKVEILRVVCSDGTVLGILELQPPGKKIMNVRSFVNGLRGKYAIRWNKPPFIVSPTTTNTNPVDSDSS